MSRLWFAVSILAVCLWSVAALAPDIRAEDPKKSDKKDKKEDEKDKTPSIKRAQTSPHTTVTGKIKEVDEKTITLEGGEGKRKQKVELIIAEDVKVRTPQEQEFDEKGKPKPVKRNPNDPDSKYGVKGSKDDLREGQSVLVKVGKYQKKLVATMIVVLPEKK